MDENIQEEIIRAAELRFSHYGYRKTTMAEIALDAGMSAANIYRYFASKLDIMSACAERCSARRLQRLREVTGETGINATEKLARYALTTLHFSHELALENDKLFELIEDIKNRNPALIHRRVQTEIELIREILAEGMDTGEFVIDNPDETARAIHTSLVVFDVPLFMSLYPLSEFEAMAQSIIRLITTGLHKK